jgi:glycosyltransferase involved in cell wall biosynthesis
MTVQKGMNHFVQQMIAPSEAVKNAIIENEKVSGDKVKIIYNGIDTEYFKPALEKTFWRKKIGLQDSHFVIIIVANLYKIKGVEYFVQAASLIAQEIPESKFIIVGGGPEKDNLTKLSTKLGILGKIIFIGNISNIKDYLAASDVYVCSSLSEGFSNSILEAMAMGLPVVASDVGGNREAVADSESGFLVSAQDYQGIASKVTELYRDQKMRNQMGDKGRRIAEEQFNLKRMIKEHEKLYLDLIDQMV